MRKYILLFISGLVFSCQNLENADPAPRNTFIKFYEGPYSMEAVAVEKIPNGFAILGNMSFLSGKELKSQAVIIETDERGNRIGIFHFIDNISSRSFKPIIANNVLDKYFIVGDSIAINPEAGQAANVTVSSISALELSSTFVEIGKRRYIRDPSKDSAKVKDDYFAGPIGLTPTGAVILATFKEGINNQQNAPAEQLLFGLNSNLDSAWVKKYPLLSNTYTNAKSIHYKDGNIIWASAIADVQGDFISSYLAIPFVKEQSVPVNFSQFGETTTQRFSAKDIQPASSPAFGYGVIGTYSETTDGSNANLFFMRVASNGTIIPGSDRYYDGIKSSVDSSPIEKNSSSMIDEGEALTSTNDGGFLLSGTITTNSSKGNGGKDLLLIKVNTTGDLVWLKTVGGLGDEQPVSVIEVSNGDLVVCGTNNLSGYSSIFLMRMDKNGELKN
jgi:hypothetical protein